MNESDTRLKLIDPAIMKSWDRDTQVFTEYYFTDGEIVVRGNMVTRKDKKKALIINFIRTLPTFIRTCTDECGNPIP